MTEFEMAPQESAGFSTRSHERSLQAERDAITISPDTLYYDNQSQTSKLLRSEWRQNREDGKLIVVDKCSDARSVLQTKDLTRAVTLPSIAASGPTAPFANVYYDKRSQALVEMSHFFGPKTIPGENPPGCGGRAAKEGQMKNGENGNGDIDKYITEHVPHSDVVINSVLRASLLAESTDKPTLAAAQDHATGKIYPIASFFRSRSGAIMSTSAVPFNYLFENNYNPAQIYKEGVPALLKNELPDIFTELIERNEEWVLEMIRYYPDLTKTQAVQNPKTLRMSTSIKPKEIMYQNFSHPGSAFDIIFGRNRIDETDTIDDESLRAALNQAHYPIAHSIQHHEDESKDFAKLNRILIETSDMDLSNALALELAQKTWMQEWLSLDNHRIMTAQARAGEVSDIEWFKPRG